MHTYLIAAPLLFVAVLSLLETGRALAARRRAPGKDDGLSAIDGAVFGLMGLLIAFTFSGAAQRFEQRRQLIVQEANAIGTAWLRVDLLPAGAQPAIRQDFRDYVDARLGFYRNLPVDSQTAAVQMQRANRLQGRLWAQTVAACRTGCANPAITLPLTALNEMIDITTTRAAALETHPPKIIYEVLILLVLVSSLLAGYGMGGARSWMHTLIYAAVLTLTVYVTVDLEYPRLGLIRVDSADHLLMDVRAGMQ
ncbi:MAG: DUF4239 domain-containing protein [Acidobacteria bacterium]|nr:DUF4239 domain-containing protein [Acidobacteriota bacterium]MBW4045060.1 DUF4239 domain-containing protein [Acidobacteriota bacterium]